MLLPPNNLAVAEVYSNASSDVGAVAEAVGSLAKLKAELVKAKENRNARMAESGCKKPAILVGKKKREYLKCIDNFNQTNASAKEADRQVRITEAKLKSATELAKLAPKKFLGMPQGLGIAVAGIGTAGLILGSLYIYKKYIVTA